MKTLETSESFFYSAIKTPTILSVSPMYGSSLGGTEVTIKGNFSVWEVSGQVNPNLLLINDRPCALLGASVSEVICTTSARQGYRPLSVVLGAASGGYAIAPIGVGMRYLDKWSELNTWLNDEPPVAGDTVVIPQDQTILMDEQPPPLYLFYIVGEVVVGDEQDIAIDAHYIIVHGGHLEIGTEIRPFQHQCSITLHGNEGSPQLPLFGSKVLAVTNNAGAQQADSEWVPYGQIGVLDIHGRRRLTRWTTLAESATRGSSHIVLSTDVDFEPGDVLALSSPPERVAVAWLDGDNRTVWLDAPLRATHTAAMPAYDGRVVDLRPQVALLTRNVVIRGSKDSRDSLYGAHTMVTSLARYRVENVEFAHCGQAGHVGRHCVQFYQTGSAPPPESYVRHNSFHDGFSRAVVTFKAFDVLIEDNVAYKIEGHTFMVGDDKDTGNVLRGNLGIFLQKTLGCAKGDCKASTFAIKSPTNYWQHNVAADSMNTGIAFVMCCGSPARTAPTLALDGNVVHGSSMTRTR